MMRASHVCFTFQRLPPDVVSVRASANSATTNTITKNGKLKVKLDFSFRSELCCSGFSKITHFLGRILMEHIGLVCSLEPGLISISICSIRIHSRN